jgi:hypothetical protein
MPPPDPRRAPVNEKLSSTHILLICLLVVGIVFGSSIVLSVMYVENTHGVQTDQAPDQ